MLTDTALTAAKEAGIAGAQHVAVTGGAMATAVAVESVAGGAIAKYGVGRTVASAVAGPIAGVGTVAVSAWSSAYHSATTGESNMFHQGAGALSGLITGSNFATGESYGDTLSGRLSHAGASLVNFVAKDTIK